MSERPSKPQKLLAVSSGGGHWMQMMRLRPAFQGLDVHFASVRWDYRDEVAPLPFYRLQDATRWNKLRMILVVLQAFWLVLRLRPDIVVSTGAAPGYFALRFGKMLGARTVWIDSIANSEQMSMSGRLARRHADLWLTQWPHLAGPEGPQYRGSLL